MTTWARRLELYLYAALPLIYALFILPSASPAEVFAQSKIYILGVFLLLALLLRATAVQEVRLDQLLTLFWNQPRYILWLLGSALILSVSSALSGFSSEAWFGESNLRTGAVFYLFLGLTFWLYSTGPRPLRWGLIALLVVMNLLAVAEYLGFRPLAFIVNRRMTLNSAFPATTVGIRTHLAAVMLMLLLLPLYWYRENYRRWQFWALLILAGIGFGCTTTSSSVVGLVAALIAFLVIMRRQLGVALLIALVTLVSANVYRPLLAVNTELQQLGWVNQAAQLKDLGSTTTFQTRLILWKAAGLLIEKKPLLGWGNDTYNQHWYQYLPQKDGDQLFRLELGLQPSQKLTRINDSAAYKDLQGKTVPIQLNYIAPHNAFLDLAYSQGILGVLAFGGFVISLILYLYHRVGSVAVFALLPVLAYGVYLLAWFITVPSAGLAAIILGMQVADLRHLPARPQPARAARGPSHPRTAGFTLIELLIVIAIIGVLAAVLIPGALASRQRSYDTGAQSCGKSLQTTEAISQVDSKTYLMVGSGSDHLSGSTDGVNAMCRDANMFVRERTDSSTLVSSYVLDVWDRRGSRVYTVTPSMLQAGVSGATAFSATGAGGSNLP